jgi:hypothetical protein
MPPRTDETTALLMRARGLLERGWCRGWLAVDANANPVDPTDSSAAAWCANGALIAAGMAEPSDLSTLRFMTHPAYLRLKTAVGDTLVGFFNNGQKTVEPVLAAFDRAIAGQSAEGALHPSKTEG